MDTNNLKETTDELESVGENIATFTGNHDTRIRLLERTLSDSINLTCQISRMLLDLDTKHRALEDKFEYARLYGFSISAEDE